LLLVLPGQSGLFCARRHLVQEGDNLVLPLWTQGFPGGNCGQAAKY
jgi:hypothetical protein